MAKDRSVPETIATHLGKSLIATALATFVASMLFLLYGNEADVGLALRGSAFMLFVGFLPILCGWILALPGIVLLPYARGARFWALLAYGFLLGPIIMFVFESVASQGNPPGHWTFQLSDPFLVLGGAISATATLFYLFLIRRTPAGSA